MTPDAISEASTTFARARLERTRIDALPPRCRPPDLAGAYHIQAALADRLAAPLGAVCGYKIGCTTPVMQAYLEIPHPCAGVLHAGQQHTGEAHLPHAAFVRPGVECEIAVRIGTTLAPADAPFDDAAIARAVEGCMAAIEIVDDRYVDYRALDTPTLVADDFFNAASVIGEARTDWRAPDIPALAGRMTINGTEVGRGTAADVMGHPFRALAWLASSLAERGIALEAGAIVLTGSVVETHWVGPGDHVRVAIEGLGEASVVFES